MELEDNGIGDVIEGEDQRELVLFQWEDDAGLLSLRVLTTDNRPARECQAGGDDVDGLMFWGGGVTLE